MLDFELLEPKRLGPPKVPPCVFVILSKFKSMFVGNSPEVWIGFVYATVFGTWAGFEVNENGLEVAFWPNIAELFLGWDVAALFPVAIGITVLSPEDLGLVVGIKFHGLELGSMVLGGPPNIFGLLLIKFILTIFKSYS